MSKVAVSIQESDNTINVAKANAPHPRSSSSFLPSTLAPLVAGSQFISNTTKPLIQPKLKIGAPYDKYEQEADKVANQVMRMPGLSGSRTTGITNNSSSPTIQRLCPGCEDDVQRQPQAKHPQINTVVNRITPLVQRQEEPEEEEEIQPGSDQVPEETTPILDSVPTGDAEELGKEEEEDVVQTKHTASTVPQVTPGIENNIQSLKGSGQPLPVSERAFFEPRFGTDFSHVRVHTDSRAAQTAQSINARAFTLGRNVVFGSGQYSPGTRSCRRLLAHELTHVVQQRKSMDLKEEKKIERIIDKVWFQRLKPHIMGDRHGPQPAQAPLAFRCVKAVPSHTIGPTDIEFYRQSIRNRLAGQLPQANMVDEPAVQRKNHKGQLRDYLVPSEQTLAGAGSGWLAATHHIFDVNMIPYVGRSLLYLYIALGKRTKYLERAKHFRLKSRTRSNISRVSRYRRIARRYARHALKFKRAAIKKIDTLYAPNLRTAIKAAYIEYLGSKSTRMLSVLGRSSAKRADYGRFLRPLEQLIKAIRDFKEYRSAGYGANNHLWEIATGVRKWRRPSKL